MGSLTSKVVGRTGSVIMSSVKDTVNLKLSQKKVLVISKSACPFCTKAKNVLAKYNLSSDAYEVMEIDKLPDGSAIQDYMQELTGARSVPRVFINGKFVGGGDDTVALDNEGKLEVMLKECGAI